MDYDFITTVNFTSTGITNLGAYRGSETSIHASVSLFYRKLGDPTWIETTDGTMNVTSAGEWQIANDFNKVGNDCLTHSLEAVLGFDEITDFYMDETVLTTTVGNYFLYNYCHGSSFLVTIGASVSLPQNLLVVGDWFCANIFRDCLRLPAIPSTFQFPQNLTTVGDYFLLYALADNYSLQDLGTFQIAPGITSVGSFFLGSMLWETDNLQTMPAGFNIPTGIVGTDMEGFLSRTWDGCTDLRSLPAGFTMPQGITGATGDHFMDRTFAGFRWMTLFPAGFNLPQNITGVVGEYFLFSGFSDHQVLQRLPVDFNLPQGITGGGYNSFVSTFASCDALKTLPVGFQIPPGLTDLTLAAPASGMFASTGLTDVSNTEPLNFRYSAQYIFNFTLPLIKPPTGDVTGTSTVTDVVPISRDGIPDVDTWGVTNIDKNQAQFNLYLNDPGITPTTTLGWYYMEGATGTPTAADSTYFITGDFAAGEYNELVTGLSSSTNYRYTAFAENSTGLVISSVVGGFETLSGQPTVYTGNVTNISLARATLNGNISEIGLENATVRGFYYVQASSGDPGPGDIVVSETGDFGIGVFSQILTTVVAGLEYRVAAFATNSYGTDVGATTSFIGGTAVLALETDAASSVETTSAVLNGEVIDIGGALAITRGFYWIQSDVGEPAAADNVVSEDGEFNTGTFDLALSTLVGDTDYRVIAFADNGINTSVGTTVGFTTPDYTQEKTVISGTTGAMSSILEPLGPNQLYYIRSYATNTQGTAYGTETSFTTGPDGRPITNFMDSGSSS